MLISFRQIVHLMANEATKDTMVRFRMDDITAQLLDRARTYVEVNKSKFIRQSIREYVIVPLHPAWLIKNGSYASKLS